MKLSNTARLLCLVLSMTLIMGLMIGCRQSPEAEVTHILYYPKHSAYEDK